mmetsp:Transcript_15371/g.33321  ORF Transcript_15371/g.33321 Transcript_15371/m.33321 type:complete len:306 (+) Transcript_15371:1368-2285(+)
MPLAPINLPIRTDCLSFRIVIIQRPQWWTGLIIIFTIILLTIQNEICRSVLIASRNCHRGLGLRCWLSRRRSLRTSRSIARRRCWTVFGYRAASAIATIARTQVFPNQRPILALGRFKLVLVTEFRQCALIVGSSKAHFGFLTVGLVALELWFAVIAIGCRSHHYLSTTARILTRSRISIRPAIRRWPCRCRSSRGLLPLAQVRFQRSTAIRDASLDNPSVLLVAHADDSPYVSVDWTAADLGGGVATGGREGVFLAFVDNNGCRCGSSSRSTGVRCYSLPCFVGVMELPWGIRTGAGKANIINS